MARDFDRAFAIARDGGLLSAPHGGELAGPASVRDCLDDLEAHRIGHGVRAADDPRLMKRLADRGVTCEVCPASNVALGVYDKPEDVPLRTLFEAGVPMALGADDPLLFGSRLAAQYEIARRHHDFTDAELAELARQSVRGRRPRRTSRRSCCPTSTPGWPPRPPEMGQGRIRLEADVQLRPRPRDRGSSVVSEALSTSYPLSAPLPSGPKPAARPIRRGRGGEGVPRAGQEQRPGVDGGPDAAYPGQAVPAALPELLPGGAVARGAPFVGANGPRNAVSEPAAQGGPHGGPQSERLVGEHQIDGHARGVVPGHAPPERDVDDRVREYAAKENSPARRASPSWSPTR